jgi:hypothetical protein
MNALVERYQFLKKECPIPGVGKGFHALMYGVACAGAEARLDKEVVIKDLRAIADRGSRVVPDAEITATIDNAYSKDDSGDSRKASPAIAGALTLQHIIQKGSSFNLDDIRRVSPVPIPSDPQEQACLFLQTLFASSDFIFVGRQYNSKPPYVQSVAQHLENNPTRWPHLTINPLTGSAAPLKGGGTKLTYRGDNCVVDHRFCLVEFDSIAIEDQIRFFAGIDLGFAALVYSGKDSIHGWLSVNVADAVEWRDKIVPLYKSRFNPMGIDRTCSNPSRLTRMPGHYRKDTNRYQDLLFLDPSARGPRFYLIGGHHVPS